MSRSSSRSSSGSFPPLVFALPDFPYLHCSINQKLFTLKTYCGTSRARRAQQRSEPDEPVKMAESLITKEAAGGYYYGLRSHPKLVARSDIEDKPWISLGALVMMAGRDLWTGTIAELRDLNWTAINILRLGYARRLNTLNEPDDMFPKLLISVQPESTSWQSGYTATLQCRQVLREHGINDVEVEMMEAWVSRCSSPRLTSQPITEYIQEAAQLSEFLGRFYCKPVQEREMRQPFEAARNLKNKPPMVVAKFGRTTGLTFGVANEAKSVLRKMIAGETFMSDELCIIGQKKKKGLCREVFFSKGDSGACILDMYGQVAGMLTSGMEARNEDAFEITYATPIEWLLKDIRGYGLEVTLA
ncbi:hypothetical protein F25303_2531 [Fusarium sp. NRRL 25303]|nr:hypothetical protein F25303_2531 [Fusarium sp. NRRL 25303]